MFWDRRALTWKRHPLCHCRPATDLMSGCYCKGLPALDDDGQPIRGLVEELYPKKREDKDDGGQIV
jgi:hypothetical protein